MLGMLLPMLVSAQQPDLLNNTHGLATYAPTLCIHEKTSPAYAITETEAEIAVVKNSSTPTSIPHTLDTDLRKDANKKQAIDAPMYVYANSDRVCVGDSVDLHATCYTGTVRWYSTATGTELIGTGEVFKFSPISNSVYYAACYHDFQESSRVATGEVRILAKPNMPTGVTISKKKVCRGTEVSLTGSCSDGTLVWYLTQTQTEADSMGIGTNYKIIPTQDTRYYAACSNGLCTTNRVPTDTVMVLDVPDQPTDVYTDRTQVCSLTPVNMSGACAAGGAYWYDSPTGGSVLDGGTQSPETSVTYYCVCINQMCESPRVPTTPIDVIPQPKLPTYVTVNKTSICRGQSITLSATCEIGTAAWYRYPQGSSTFLGRGNTITITPDSTNTYFASCENGICFSERIRTEEVVVNDHLDSPTNVMVDKAEVCGGSPVSLSASFTAGTLYWYTSASGGTSIGSGNNLVHNPDANTTYYAACETGGCTSARVASAPLTVTSKPGRPGISGIATICSGESVQLTASANNANVTYYWSNGATGMAVAVSPATTTNYQVLIKDNNCASDSSTIFRIVVNPKPAIPSITTNNPAICKGGSTLVTGETINPADSFYWSTPTQNARTTATTASNKNIRMITEPGVYKGWSESALGCRSAEGSITIMQAGNCNGQNFITIMPAKPVICPNTTVMLTASGCSGTITWTDGNTSQTGTYIKVSPIVTTSYIINCSTGGIANIDVVVAQTNVTVTNNVSTGVERTKAILALESSKKIGEPDYTPAPNVCYEAGKSIVLKPGFVVEKYSVFSAEIRGCE
ncbi:hypothetical protein GCM10027442_41110 [Emticicia fontis]